MIFTNRHALALMLLAGSLATATTAPAALGRSGAASVSFAAVGPAGLTIAGTTSDLIVSESGGEVTVRVPLANLDTGIALRNKHMREKYLQVQSYPNADLVVSRAALTLPGSDGETRGEATGTMRLHGNARPVRFAYRAKRDGGGYKVTGSVHLDMNDFGIEVPRYLGVTVKPDVDVNVAFSAVE